jgi:hypothetical protein
MSELPMMDETGNNSFKTSLISGKERHQEFNLDSEAALPFSLLAVLLEWLEWGMAGACVRPVMSLINLPAEAFLHCCWCLC